MTELRAILLPNFDSRFENFRLYTVVVNPHLPIQEQRIGASVNGIMAELSLWDVAGIIFGGDEK